MRWSKRSRRSSSTICWPMPGEHAATSSCRAPTRRARRRCRATTSSVSRSGSDGLDARCRSRRRRSSSRRRAPRPRRAAISITKASRSRRPDGVAPEAGEPGACFYAARASSPKSSVKAPPSRIRSCGRPLSTMRPPLEHDGAVGDENGREPLARDQHGAPRDGGAEGRHEDDAPSRCRRQTSGRPARSRAPGDERSRERDALTLPAGEVHAALADQRVVAVRQPVDERRDTPAASQAASTSAQSASGRAASRLSRSGTENSTGFCVTSATERRSSASGDVAAVDAADQHPPGGRVVEARQQVQQRRLARARGAADGDDLAAAATSRSTPESTSCPVP